MNKNNQNPGVHSGSINKKLKRKYLAALRGGTWDQCQGGLRRGDSRCALGVLAEVMGIQIDECGFLSADDDDRFMREVSYGNQVEIVQLNDKKCWSFAQIADWVETNL